VIKRIARLEVRARYIVEGFLSGSHRSPYFGQSVEFVQHREYVSGDDLRRIDWKVWAKQDRYYVKQYEEETNLRCTFLVDTSESMQYGSGPLTKYDCAATIAASLAYLILRQHDAVGCITFDEAPRATVPMRAAMSQLDLIVRALENSQPSAKTDMYRIIRQSAELLPRRGMVVLISDLLADRDGLRRGLRMLRQRGHDVMLFHVLDDDELTFPFSGPTKFEGLELPQHLNCNPRALREGYLEALERFLGEVRQMCGRHVVDYSLVRTSEPLDAALAQYLSNRLGMHHRN
jgi:uncharacterized protein (DUF58 family)